MRTSVAEIGERGAVRGRRGAFEDDFVPIAHSEFGGAAQNPLTRATVNLGGFDLFLAERRSDRGERRFQTDASVRRAANGRKDAALSAVDLAERSLFAVFRLERFGGNDFADVNAVDVTGQRRPTFDFGGRHRQTVGDDFRLDVGNVDKIGNPVKRDKHGRLGKIGGRSGNVPPTKNRGKTGKSRQLKQNVAPSLSTRRRDVRLS